MVNNTYIFNVCCFRLNARSHLCTHSQLHTRVTYVTSCMGPVCFNNKWLRTIGHIHDVTTRCSGIICSEPSDTVELVRISSLLQYNVQHFELHIFTSLFLMSASANRPQPFLQHTSNTSASATGCSPRTTIQKNGTKENDLNQNYSICENVMKSLTLVRFGNNSHTAHVAKWVTLRSNNI